MPGMHKVGDVTLKRGIINSKILWDWISRRARTGAGGQAERHHHAARRGRQPVQTWVLRNVIPMKYTGPTLAAKGGGDVAMEELVLSAQALEVEV